MNGERGSREAPSLFSCRIRPNKCRAKPIIYIIGIHTKVSTTYTTPHATDNHPFHGRRLV